MKKKKTILLLSPTHALLLQALRLGYSGKLDKGRAENFISTQEI
jgi:hypothetical protein